MPEQKRQPGWYPDPSGQPELHYFDGNAWTGKNRPFVNEPKMPLSPIRQQASSVNPRWIIAVAVIGLPIIVRLISGHGSTHSVTPANILPAIVVPSNSDTYLDAVKQNYFAKNFTDGQLLAEGRKVCDAAAHHPDQALENMVRHDLSVSDTAAIFVVINAKILLGC